MIPFNSLCKLHVSRKHHSMHFILQLNITIKLLRTRINKILLTDLEDRKFNSQGGSYILSTYFKSKHYTA